MPLGPGKYDPLCTIVREMTNADGVVLAVFGPQGVGFSIQANETINGLAIANALELVVKEIRESYDAHVRGSLND